MRLGPDYTPTFSNLSAFDPYGATAFAGVANLLGGSPGSVSTLGSGAGTVARSDNSIGYFMPSWNGVYGTVMASAGEGTNASNGNSQYVGGRIGCASGPIDVAAAYGRTKIPGNGDFRVWNAGVSYNFQFVKLMMLTHRAGYMPTGLAARSHQIWGLGARVPVGQGEIRATYQRSDLSGGTAAPLRNQDDALQYAIGYVHNLSKRTALYTDVGRVANHGLSAQAIGGGSTVSGAVGNRDSTAYVVGVRHSF